MELTKQSSASAEGIWKELAILKKFFFLETQLAPAAVKMRSRHRRTLPGGVRFLRVLADPGYEQETK